MTENFTDELTKNKILGLRGGRYPIGGSFFGNHHFEGFWVMLKMLNIIRNEVKEGTITIYSIGWLGEVRVRK